jgi:DeoR/GlpR family transcriptional regulator of sugar metabolism
MTSLFEIKSINVFSSWVFNLPKNNDCTICRCNLNVPSLYNQEKGTDSYVVSGVCQHSFHYECIKPWTDKNKHCPICAQLWQYQQMTNDYNEDSIPILKEMINNIDKKINIINQTKFDNNEKYTIKNKK